AAPGAAGGDRSASGGLGNGWVLAGGGGAVGGSRCSRTSADSPCRMKTAWGVKRGGWGGVGGKTVASALLSTPHAPRPTAEGLYRVEPRQRPSCTFLWTFLRPGRKRPPIEQPLSPEPNRVRLLVPVGQGPDDRRRIGTGPGGIDRHRRRVRVERV